MVMPDGTQQDYKLAKKGIKGRGNSSWVKHPKKGYNLNFDDKVAFFGLPKSKKWCFVANYSDKPLLRNKYASFLGLELFNNQWNPTLTSVDWFVNGEYIGNYIFCEKNTLEKGRVEYQDIADYTESKIAKGDYTDQNNDGVIDIKDGGFILEVDNRDDADFYFLTKKKIHVTLKEPDDGDEDTRNRIKDVVQTAEDVLFSDNFMDKESGWRNYIDEDAMIDWFIVNELAKNIDSRFGKSVYICFNPADGKLYMGPNWDFDIGFGNINYYNCDTYEGWHVKNASWVSRMFEDSDFVLKLKKRWNEKKASLYHTFADNDGIIQTLANENAVSADLNFIRWKILGKYVSPNPDGYAERTTYQSEIDFMRNWLSGRYAWMDKTINELYPIVAVDGALTTITDATGDIRVIIDGDCGEPLNIETGFVAKTVTYKRNFAENVTTTVMLPFDFSSTSFNGSFYTMSDISPIGDGTIAWKINSEEVSGMLSANMPYLFKASADITEIVFEDVDLQATEDGSVLLGDKDEWIFQGVYTQKEWENETLEDYCFGIPPTEANDGQDFKQFVHADNNSKINPTSAYFKFDEGKNIETAIPQPAQIIVLFPGETINEELFTPVAELIPNANVKVWSHEKNIFIEGREGMEYSIVDMGGRLLRHSITQSDIETIQLNIKYGGIMIVHTAGKNYKIIY